MVVVAGETVMEPPEGVEPEFVRDPVQDSPPAGSVPPEMTHDTAPLQLQSISELSGGTIVEGFGFTVHIGGAPVTVTVVDVLTPPEVQVTGYFPVVFQLSVMELPVVGGTPEPVQV
jgi:hypothetical protein